MVEIHDCFSANEMITYEALGLCEVGKAGEFVERTWLGRDGPVCNPCGGLISKGHPLGATGINILKIVSFAELAFIELTSVKVFSVLL